jgi:phosphatidylglycerophosphate synthase
MRTPAAIAAPRRAVATRDARWARRLAHGLAAAGVRPNTVSVASVACALASGAALLLSPRAGEGARGALLLIAAAAIQLRLLCNLLDGLLAVEEGLKGPTGEIYNELPDRLADVLILVGAGYAAPEIAVATTAGWAAAMLAVFTAYVRVLAGSLGLTQHFLGPMAKQHRMFTLTVATLASAIEVWSGAAPRALVAGLGLIAIGALVTAGRRTRRMLQEAAAR